MDKKATMQTIFDGRVELYEKLVDTMDKLYSLKANYLRDIARSLDKDVSILRNGEPFWDGLTDARISAEQESYLLDKAIVNRIAEMTNELQEYLENLTQ